MCRSALFMDPVSFMVKFLRDEGIHFLLELQKIRLFHSQDLRVNSQAPFLIPDVIPAEYQESCEHHAQKQTSWINNHHSSEKAFIQSIRKKHPRGSNNHKIESAKPPQIDPRKKGSNTRNFQQIFADSIRNRIISGNILFLSQSTTLRE